MKKQMILLGMLMAFLYGRGQSNTACIIHRQYGITTKIECHFSWPFIYKKKK